MGMEVTIARVSGQPTRTPAVKGERSSFIATLGCLKNPKALIPVSSFSC